MREPRKLYRLARQRDLDVTQAMVAFEALKADVGRQAQAPRPHTLGKSTAEGPNDRQADLIDFSQNTRGKTRYGLVLPWNLFRTRTLGLATGADGGRELCGHDGARR